MTIDEFVAALDEAMTALRLRPAADRVGLRLYRCRSDEAVCYCPITAVAQHRTGERYRVWDYDEAAQQIGLTGDDARDIAAAADNVDVLNDELRRRLLAVAHRPRIGL